MWLEPLCSVCCPRNSELCERAKKNKRIDCQEPQKAQCVCWNGVLLTGAARIYGHKYHCAAQPLPTLQRPFQSIIYHLSFIRCQICLFRVTTRFDHTFCASLPFFFPLIPVQCKHRVVVFFISACLLFAFHLCIHYPSPVTGS